MTEAPDRLAAVHARIQRAAHRAGRDPQTVRLIAISKTRTADEIRPLIAAGQRAFGENRVQEAQAKWPELRTGEGLSGKNAITLDMVGQLQTNKAADAVALFDAIHSVDRPRLIDAIAAAQDGGGLRPDIFLQVALDGSGARGGCTLADLPGLLSQARNAGLNVVGLMAVAPLAREPAPWFALIAEHARRLGLARLSMGMTDDFETAIALGATDIRIGSALFGERRT